MQFSQDNDGISNFTNNTSKHLCSSRGADFSIRHTADCSRAIKEVRRLLDDAHRDNHFEQSQALQKRIDRFRMYTGPATTQILSFRLVAYLIELDKTSSEAVAKATDISDLEDILVFKREMTDKEKERLAEHFNIPVEALNYKLPPGDPLDF